MITDRDLWEESSLKDALADLIRESHMRKILMLVVQGRFGYPEDDVIAAIEKADEKQMLSLATRVGTDTLPQFRERLGLMPAP